MSVTAQTSFVEYVGNGTTTTGYTITFEYQDAADIAVYVDAVAYANFSITGGKVYTGTAIAATSEVRIENAVPYAQDLELVEGGDFSSSLSERAWDRSVLMIQQLRDAIGRCLRMKRGATPAEMAEATDVYPYIDASGNLVSRTAAQVAADVTPELNFTAASTKVTVTVADAAARAALVPDFTGQVLVQLDNNNVYVSTATTAGAWSLFGTDVVTVADATARAAKVPDYYGQLAYQSDTAEFFVAHGLTAGKWAKFRQGPASIVVADAAARAAAAPAFIGQYAYQTDTAAWYKGTSTADGGWTLAAAWAGTTAYTLGDIVSSNGLLWECVSTHAASATWNTPGSGSGYEKYWDPWVVQGFHWDYHTGPSGDALDDHVILGTGGLLPNWSFAINHLIGRALAYNGGGSGNSAWLDGTPLANPVAWADVTAYTAGDFVLRSAVRYKCHTSHTSNSPIDAPGTGSAWEDAWIVYTYDHRTAGTIEFSGGDYYLKSPLRVPPSVTIYSQVQHAQRRSQILAASGWSGTYMLEGIYRDAVDSNANFFNSILDVTLNPNSLCKAAFWCASHGSTFRAEVKNHGRFTPLTMGDRCDDATIQLMLTDTATPSIRAPYGIYCVDSILACTFLNCNIGQCAVGISFQDLEGVAVIGLETESTTLPIEVRMRDNDALFPETWATSTAYAIGDRLMHDDGGASGSDRYRCFNAIASSVAAQQPGVGADWEDYFERIADSGVQGRCGGLTVIGGRWLRHSTDTTHEECCMIRYDTSNNYDSFTMQGVFLDSGGSATWKFVTVNSVSTGHTHDYPLTQNMDEVNNQLTADFDLKRMLDWSVGTGRQHDYFGTGGDFAKTQDTRWVANDNPPVFATARNEDVTLYKGFYEVEVTGTWDGASIVIDDRDGIPISGLASITANRTVTIWNGAQQTVNVAMATPGGTTSVNVYFKPLRLT